MTPIATILVATDFSPDGNNAGVAGRAAGAAARRTPETDARGAHRRLQAAAPLALAADRHRPARRSGAPTLRQLSAGSRAATTDGWPRWSARRRSGTRSCLRASAQADLLVLGRRGRKPGRAW